MFCFAGDFATFLRTISSTDYERILPSQNDLDTNNADYEAIYNSRKRSAEFANQEFCSKRSSFYEEPNVFSFLSEDAFDDFYTGGGSADLIPPSEGSQSCKEKSFEPGDRPVPGPGARAQEGRGDGQL